MRSRRLFLQAMCNRFGDFKVAAAGKKSDGSAWWSKHRSVLECWHSEEGLKFLDAANNRQILPHEIVLDLDDDITKSNLERIYSVVEYYHLSYRAYFSGSRGYHVHVLIKDFDFISMDRFSREKIKEFLISKLGCDLCKKSEKTMIALEGVPHWKTGKLKECIGGCF